MILTKNRASVIPTLVNRTGRTTATRDKHNYTNKKDHSNYTTHNSTSENKCITQEFSTDYSHIKKY